MHAPRSAAPLLYTSLRLLTSLARPASPPLLQVLMLTGGSRCS